MQCHFFLALGLHLFGIPLFCGLNKTGQDETVLTVADFNIAASNKHQVITCVLILLELPAGFWALVSDALSRC